MFHKLKNLYYVKNIKKNIAGKNIMSKEIFIAFASWLISLFTLLWLIALEYYKSLDFVADIIELPPKDKRRADENNQPQEPAYVRIYIANKGCPTTIRGLFMMEASDETQLIIDALPKKLERGEVLQFYDKDLPSPIGFSHFKKPDCTFYVLDGAGKKYWMNKVYWNPGTDQPKTIRKIQS